MTDDFVYNLVNDITCDHSQGFIYRGGQGGSFPPKNFMYINDVIQKMVSN